MIRRIQAINYRSLKSIDVSLGNFNVLVGPNASGKSTLLSVLSFLSDFVSHGLEAAVQKSGTRNFLDLMWRRSVQRFELGIDVVIPEEHRAQLFSQEADVVRYQVAIGYEEDLNTLEVLDEWIVLGSFAGLSVARKFKANIETTLFRSWEGSPSSIRLVGKRARTEDEWVTELENPSLFPDDPHGYYDKLIPDSSIFKAVRGGRKSPVSMWLGNFLRFAIHRIELQSSTLRLASPAGMGKTLLEDGSNLPWVVYKFHEESPRSYQDWLAHLRTALPDLIEVRSEFDPGRNERFLMLRFIGDLEVPSWVVSDGTLRLLALTILAYLPAPKPIYLIEEPENSIHPLNVETVMQSLQSVYDGQVFVTTHSPAILAVTEPAQVLVFSRDEIDGTQVVRGSEHPGLRDWHGEIDLGTLFAGGVLG